MLGSVNNSDLAFVFQIAVNTASGVVDRGKLRRAIERNRRNNLCCPRVDNSCRSARVIEYVHFAALGLENYRIGIFASVYVLDRVKCLEINDAAFRFLSV